jgi:uncharacterized Zn finger protein
MPRLKKAAPERVAIELPRCPNCGGQMMLTRIEPERPGYDRRLFECKECGHSETTIVQFREARAEDGVSATQLALSPADAPRH